MITNYDTTPGGKGLPVTGFRFAEPSVLLTALRPPRPQGLCGTKSIDDITIDFLIRASYAETLLVAAGWSDREALCEVGKRHQLDGARFADRTLGSIFAYLCECGRTGQVPTPEQYLAGPAERDASPLGRADFGFLDDLIYNVCPDVALIDSYAATVRRLIDDRDNQIRECLKTLGYLAYDEDHYEVCVRRRNHTRASGPIGRSPQSRRLFSRA